MFLRKIRCKIYLVSSVIKIPRSSTTIIISKCFAIKLIIIWFMGW